MIMFLVLAYQDGFKVIRGEVTDWGVGFEMRGGEGLKRGGRGVGGCVAAVAAGLVGF